MNAGLSSTNGPPGGASFNPGRCSHSLPVLDVARLRLRASGRCGLALDRNPPLPAAHCCHLRGIFQSRAVFSLPAGPRRSLQITSKQRLMPPGVVAALAGRAHNPSVAALSASSRALPGGLMLASQPPGFSPASVRSRPPCFEPQSTPCGGPFNLFEAIFNHAAV
jgi:hypothetical protein